MIYEIMGKKWNTVYDALGYLESTTKVDKGLVDAPLKGLKACAAFDYCRRIGLVRKLSTPIKL